MNKVLALAGLLMPVVVGCSVPLTEEERYELDDRYVLALEAFDRTEISCNKVGGVIEVSRWSSSRIVRPLTLHEMRTARCVRLY